MKKWKAILAVLSIFALGAVVGGLITLRIVEVRLKNFVRRGPNGVAELVEQRLDRRLHLDDRQRSEVAKAVEKARGQLREIRRETEPRVQGVFRSATDEIRDVLNEEQKSEFERMVQRARRHMVD